VSLVLDRPAAPAANAAWTGLLLDEWTEVIPAVSATTGISFHYRAPAAQAPQAVLLAVPPSPGGDWNLEVLLAIVNETLDLARLRALDRSSLGALGQVLPATCLAFNPSGDTVSTDFRRLVRAE
jgi:hypothetical protein